MRLGQFARKLSLSTRRIVDIIQQEGGSIDEGSNSRIEDHQIRLVLKHIGVSWDEFLGQQEGIPAVEEGEDEDPQMEEQNPDLEDSLDEYTGVEEPQEMALERAEEMGEEQPKIEVIKAPKQELPGLRVVGKIELPEPKVKEENPQEEVPPSAGMSEKDEGNEPKSNQGRKRFRNEKRKSRSSSRRNSVVVQREREAKEAERRKRKEAQQQKEARTNNYLKKVKPAPPKKALKIYNEQVIELDEELRETKKNTSRSIWAKLWRHLRREN